MGTLFVIATPIGNLEDITIRAIKTLFTVDGIACEDTRRTGLLLDQLTKRYTTVIGGLDGKRPELLRYDNRTEAIITPEIIDRLHQGNNVALVSDAGTPLVSDPGFILVREAIRKNIPIVSIPGPSAFLAALTTSGLPTDKFLFLGYPPEKKSKRIALFHELLSSLQTSKHFHPTILFYCAPHKLDQTLIDLKEVFGDIEIVITRELTKVHEEIQKYFVSEAIQQISQPHGEYVILFNLTY